MPPIVVCTVDGKSLPVLEASVKAYAPEAELLVFSPRCETSGQSFTVALKEAFKTHDEVIVCADDVVLAPDSYQILMEDVERLKGLHGEKLGFVGVNADYARSAQNIRFPQGGEIVEGRWSWEKVCRKVKVLSPFFGWYSKKAFEAAPIMDIEWYSDDILCEDLNALGYVHYVSRAYVHHAGSQTIGRDYAAQQFAAQKWIAKNRPEFYSRFFGGKEQVMEETTRKLKICVYAISKNEESFVERWAESARDADLLLLADTGSTDSTIEKAKDCGVDVHSICITPWRFDHARNASLALIPKDFDVCICLDLDEVMEPGWREEIERVWTPSTTHLRYKFDWSSGIVFYSEKIHARHGYYWHHPCHEHIRADGRISEVWAQTDFLLISHHPDAGKSRGHYMETLELSVREDPHCPRNAFYYARELYFYARWADAIVALEKYLKMPEATWVNDRCYALRLIGECHAALGDQGAAESWYHKAAAEAPHTREPWMALTKLYYDQGRWAECYGTACRALSITHKQLVYTTDPAAWGWLPHDFAAIAAWRLGLKDVALAQGQIACELSPEDPRLTENLKWYKGEIA
jgi:hypothetical protein